MKAKNPTPTIMVRFKGAGQTRVFRPHDTVKGLVEINPISNINCRSVEVKIGWHTEGRGTRNEGYAYVDRRDDITQLEVGTPIIIDFDYNLPVEPWSYSGTLISIVWSVDVKIDIPMGRDINHSESFVLQP